ncbi:MAG TPA: YciI family protein [Gaiellaceae bacterium]|jgi:hypothetical protein|nr:YciI family protein [Gaiellaceae bacterium]
MKVLALIYGDEEKWASSGEEEREAVYAKYLAFGEAAGDKVIGGAELAPTRTATTVRVRDGQTLVTDGPFAETKEQLGGFYVFECKNLEEAEKLAAQIPGAATGTIELRMAHEDDAA